MTTPDTINGLFELAGSALTWMNVRRVWKDKGYAGIYLPAVALFFAWGFWNLFYYPHLGQWMSMAGGTICRNPKGQRTWLNMPGPKACLSTSSQRRYDRSCATCHRGSTNGQADQIPARPRLLLEAEARSRS